MKSTFRGDIVMKPSKFNLFIPIKGSNLTLGFNCVSGGLAQFSNDEVKLIKHAFSDHNCGGTLARLSVDLKEVLTKGRFVIPDHENEIQLLRQLNYKGRFKSNHLSLTIAPTLRCNFRCQYCWEQHKKVDMTPEIEDCLVSWVHKKLGSLKRLFVTWFGGEPLMQKKTILGLSEKFLSLCSQLKIPYSAKMVSNGYLLNRNTAMQLKDVKVSEVQITIDGPEWIHDRRRRLKNGKGTFLRIVENIEEIHDLVRIIVRVNIDRTNLYYVPELIDFFVTNDLHKKVFLYFGHVMPFSDICVGMQGDCLNVEKFAQHEAFLSLELIERGFISGKYARPKRGFCMADSATGWVIAPDGKVLKCWNELGTCNAAAVDDVVYGQTEKMCLTLEKWLNWDPFEKQGCRNCDILPICMGGCPYLSFRFPDEKHGFCSTWKYNLYETLLLTYLRYEKKKDLGAISRIIHEIISETIMEEKNQKYE